MAIIQSNYIPWKGYFDLMNTADDFVLYDDVQFTRNDWRNRNRIKTHQGLQWLTIPVEREFGCRIDEAVVASGRWARKHWLSLEQSYRRARHFERYASELRETYEQCADERKLCRISHRFIELVRGWLGISTPMHASRRWPAVADATARLVTICRDLGASTYVSGPAARAYLDEARFSEAGIEVAYADYSHYPSYAQLFPPFEHHVSVLDLVLNEGPEAGRYMRTFGVGAADFLLPTQAAAARQEAR